MAAGATAAKAPVARAVEALRHRGPDGGGVWQEARACLGHRRLSVIDVANSPQPWVSDDERHVLVFNGEIYNYVELREELQAAGHCFRSDGDTEVLMALFRRHGEACLQRLNGMFAFAVWDREEGTLFAARDRTGKKPFYYAASEGRLAFASELPALHHFDFIDTGIDTDAVHDYFAYQYIDGERTIYRGVRKLPPAHLLWLRDGAIQVRRYWYPQVDPVARSDEDVVAAFQELFTDAVRIRLRSDVALGAFLSGGLDSAAVVATMSAMGAQVKSFTVGFEGEDSYDEREPARRIAAHFATEHHEQGASLDPARTLRSATAHLGEPMADPSCIPTWHLCRHAREAVTVALSGDGADELFAGYQRYRARPLVGAYLRLPRGLRRAVTEPAIDGLRESDRYYGASRVKQVKLLLAMARRLEQAPGDLSPQLFDAEARTRLFDAELIRTRVRDDVTRLGLKRLDPVTQMMVTDLHGYLAEDILTKVDRMSMAHGLEVRSPFLDYRLVEFAARAPLRCKLRGSTGKWLVRRAFEGALPAWVLGRRKHGFAVPLGAWFKGPLRAVFQEKVLEGPGMDFLNLTELQRLWAQHQAGQADNGFKLWALLCFFDWYEAARGQEWDARRRIPQAAQAQ